MRHVVVAGFGRSQSERANNHQTVLLLLKRSCTWFNRHRRGCRLKRTQSQLENPRGRIHFRSVFRAATCPPPTRGCALSLFDRKRLTRCACRAPHRGRTVLVGGGNSRPDENVKRFFAASVGHLSSRRCSGHSNKHNCVPRSHLFYRIL